MKTLISFALNLKLLPLINNNPMDFTMPIFVAQIALYIFLIIFLTRSFSQKRRRKESFSNAMLIVEVLAMILLVFCFINYDISSFKNEKYFGVFSLITLLSVVGYWLNKVVLHSSKYIKILCLTFLGTLFWLCLLTAIKFGPYLPNAWFPVLGLLALAPLIIGVITLSEIRYQSTLSNRFKMMKILALGLIPLILIQITMNFFTPYPWEFIKIFEPSNQFF